MEKRPRNPLAVTITAAAVLILAAGYCVGAVHAVLSYSALAALRLSVPAWYFPLENLVWGVVWGILGIALWAGKPWARRGTLAALPVQFLFWLADDRLLTRSTIALQSFAFDVLVRLALCALGAAALLAAGRTNRSAANSSAGGREISPEKATHADR